MSGSYSVNSGDSANSSGSYPPEEESVHSVNYESYDVESQHSIPSGGDTYSIGYESDGHAEDEPPSEGYPMEYEPENDYYVPHVSAPKVKFYFVPVRGD